MDGGSSFLRAADGDEHKVENVMGSVFVTVGFRVALAPFHAAFVACVMYE